MFIIYYSLSIFFVLLSTILFSHLISSAFFQRLQCLLNNARQKLDAASCHVCLKRLEATATFSFRDLSGITELRSRRAIRVQTGKKSTSRFLSENYLLILMIAFLPFNFAFAAEECKDHCEEKEVKVQPIDHKHEQVLNQNKIQVQGQSKEHGENDTCGHAHAPSADVTASAPPREKAHNHAHGGDACGDSSKPLAERMQEPCEHNIPIIKCDKCRFEVGAVKLSSSTQALVKVSTIQTSPAPRAIDIVGELILDENHQLVITSRVTGRLASLTAKIGTNVKENDVVAVIESSELAQTVLDFLKRLSEISFVEKKLARSELLFAKKVGAEQDVQEAQSAKDLAVLEVKNARDRLKIFGLSESDIEQLTKNRNNQLVQGKIILKSAMGGVVIQRDGTIGEIIPGDRKLLTIANICHLTAIGQIHEKQLEEVFSALNKGKIPVEITVDGFPQKSFFGELTSIDTQMREETRTLPVRIEVDNHSSLLRPGMFAKLRLLLEDSQNQTMLPDSAIMENEGSFFVFKQIEPDLFLRQDVIAGRKVGSNRIVQSGITAGDVVAIEGAFLLKSDILREKMGAGCAD
ncbi:MAG: efflux RND transporter periplasmic adaptor subunit [Candidatus Riflebacteria bacterium]|nr:efflux RND transporter periplasmic adaptor subunit [Candidatus Riflebacteria bacterium]